MFSTRLFASTPVHSLYQGMSTLWMMSSIVLFASTPLPTCVRNFDQVRFWLFGTSLVGEGAVAGAVGLQVELRDGLSTLTHDAVLAWPEKLNAPLTQASPVQRSLY